MILLLFTHKIILILSVNYDWKHDFLYIVSTWGRGKGKREGKVRTMQRHNNSKNKTKAFQSGRARSRNPLFSFSFCASHSMRYQNRFVNDWSLLRARTLLGDFINANTCQRNYNGAPGADSNKFCNIHATGQPA